MPSNFLIIVLRYFNLSHQCKGRPGVQGPKGEYGNPGSYGVQGFLSEIINSRTEKPHGLLVPY